MRKTVMLFSILCCAFTGQAQEKFTLASAQEYALDHAYGVQIAELEIQRARQIYLQNLAIGLPQASASGQYIYNVELGALVTDFDGNGVLEELVFGTDYQAQGGLVVNQLIFDGSYVVALMAAKVLKESAEIGMDQSKASLKREVAKAYHLALLSEESVEVLKANKGYLADLAEEMKKMNEAGMVSKADADQMMLNYNNVENALRYTEGQANVAKMLLKLQMGYPVQQELLLADKMEDLVVNAAAASTLTTVGFDPTKSVDYLGMANQVEGAKLQVLNKQLAYLPSIGVSYQNNIQYMSSESNIFGDAAVDIPSSLVAGSVSVPLFSSGNGRAQVQEAKIQREQAMIGLQQLEEGLIMQHGALVNEFHQGIANFLAQKENVALAKRIRDQRRKEYDEGLASSMELTQTETQYQEALQAMFMAAQNALDKKSELEYLMTKQQKQ
ncbi:TolC family protein [Schleiferiaceae bacterium]|jgi:outer membrane protein TolC|nr:TolC family protein [Bacteroidota bacterium]MCO4774990.1 TolC family protein [Flavobacteriales bacterium]MDA7722312.1 TolC family protein [Schleiferiaceae bacterium]MCH9810031.1 TolC family protein [Bacteroidota bacterium]MCO4791790.1 TolC family protein [Flavobacteriales bacterium]